MVRAERFDQRDAACQKPRIDQFKAFRAAVVGVRNILAGLKRGVAEKHYVACARRHRAKLGNIGAVHCEDKIEFLEIVRADMAGTLLCNVNTVGSCDCDRAPIRLFALMPAAGTCRINLETIGKTGFSCNTRKDAFGERRAADVAHANKENADAFHEGT